MSGTEFININSFNTLKTHNNEGNITSMPILKMKEMHLGRLYTYPNFPNSLNPVFLTSKLKFQIEFQLTVQLFIAFTSFFSAIYYFLMVILALVVSPYSFKKISTDC